MMRQAAFTHKQCLSRQAHSVFALCVNVQYIQFTQSPFSFTPRIADAIF